MNRVVCARETDLVNDVIAGRWPSAVDPDVRAHVAACATCTDVAAIAPVLRKDFVDACHDVQVPAAGQVWWRAAVRARLETAEAAAKPITWAQGLAGAGAAGLFVALIGMAWPWLRGSLGRASTLLLPSGSVSPELSAMLLGLLRQTMPLLLVVALCLVIAPVAVYLATSDD